jgi:hypothetical protein
VDGDHRDEGMRADFLNALKLVRPGGAVVMDDYDWAGVKKARPLWFRVTYVCVLLSFLTCPSCVRRVPT